MVLHLETAAHLFTLGDIKSEPRNCERGGAEELVARESSGQKSLYLCAVRDNALVTGGQVWTKCPSRHSIGPRVGGAPRSLRPRSSSS